MTTIQKEFFELLKTAVALHNEQMIEICKTKDIKALKLISLSFSHTMGGIITSANIFELAKMKAAKVTEEEVDTTLQQDILQEYAIKHMHGMAWVEENYPDFAEQVKIKTLLDKLLDEN